MNETAQTFRDRVSDFIRQNRLFEGAQTIIAAYSGGRDSTALLHILCSIKSQFNFVLLAVHVHHGLRGEEANRDAEHCEREAARLFIPFRLKRVNVPAFAKRHDLSTEEAARILRYRALEEEATGETLIATAHHRDDQAETVLMRLFKGSSLDGLAGIAVKRERVVRPLLFASRERIEAYCKAEKLNYIEDSSNNEIDAERNYIRNIVMPLIARRFPQASQKLAEFAFQAGRERAFWHRFLKEKNIGEKGDYGSIKVSIPLLLEREEVFQTKWIRQAIRDVMGQDFFPSLENIQRVVRGLSETCGNKTLLLKKGLCISRAYDTLIVERENKNFPSLPDYVTLLDGEKKVWGKLIIGMSQSNGPVKSGDCCAFSLKSRVWIRSPQRGDRIEIAAGKHQKLQDYFVNHKCSLEKRRQSVVACDEKNKILALYVRGLGWRVSSDAYVGEKEDATMLCVGEVE